MGTQYAAAVSGCIARLRTGFWSWLVGSVVYDHPVGLEDKKITTLNEDGKDSIVVILEEEGYTLCFEAGYQYVLLKTVWDNWTANGAFRVNGQDYVLRIRPSSAVEKI